MILHATLQTLDGSPPIFAAMHKISTLKKILEMSIQVGNLLSIKEYQNPL